MATVNFPKIQKSLITTVLNYSFILEDEDGNLSSIKQPERKYDMRKSRSTLNRELQKEFPDKIVKIDSVVEKSDKYVMDLETFLKHAKIEEEPVQTKLDVE